MHENVPRSIRGEVALCLFRVTQEALQNLKKHSGATSAQVRLAVEEGQIHLSVVDSGKGFDPDILAKARGIGLRSMEERMRFVSGRLAIRSRPMNGTRIEAWAPLMDETSRVDHSPTTN